MVWVQSNTEVYSSFETIYINPVLTVIKLSILAKVRVGLEKLLMFVKK